MKEKNKPMSSSEAKCKQDRIDSIMVCIRTELQSYQDQYDALEKIKQEALLREGLERL